MAPLVTRWIQRLLSQHDPPLTVPQYLALRAIERDGVTGTELAQRSGVSGPAVSQLLTVLADEGLLERQFESSDRRRLTLTPSREGRRVLAEAEALLIDRLGSLLGDLPRPEADALARSLPRVEATLSGAHPPRRPPHGPRSPKPPPQRGKGARRP